MNERELEGWLAAHRCELMSADPAKGEHLVDARLAAVIEHPGTRLEAEEIAHVAACIECQDVLIHLVRRETPWIPNPIRFGFRRPLIFLPAAAALGTLVAFLALSPLTRDQFLARGRVDAAGEASEVALLATPSDPQKPKHDLHDGDRVALSEHLGFRYGNPSGGHRTLTVLGWDGAVIHWYYPDHPGGAPLALEFGEAAQAVRLPFDIALSEHHRVGELLIAAGFDVAPEAFAARLESGGPWPPDTRLFHLEVVP
jgi:hypothetical protein